MTELHIPVLLDEVLEVFDLNAHLKKEPIIIDATLGLGGHTEALVKRGAKVLSIEADITMLKLAGERLKLACPGPHEKGMGTFRLIHANFSELVSIAQKEGFMDVDGVLFDLGVSSPQITDPGRGISFSNPGADLDMRINPEGTGVKGSDLLNLLREDQLKELFGKTLGFKSASDLARNVVSFRNIQRIESVGDFLQIIDKSISKVGKLNVATLPFLALRMAVNSEIENLEGVLPEAARIVKKGGKIAVISFHSGEDRIVKNIFKNLENTGAGIVITRSPIVPTEREVKSNPRARSAKLRVIKIN